MSLLLRSLSPLDCALADRISDKSRSPVNMLSRKLFKGWFTFSCCRRLLLCCSRVCSDDPHQMLWLHPTSTRAGNVISSPSLPFNICCKQRSNFGNLFGCFSTSRAKLLVAPVPYDGSHGIVHNWACQYIAHGITAASGTTQIVWQKAPQ